MTEHSDYVTFKHVQVVKTSMLKPLKQTARLLLHVHAVAGR